MKDDKPSIWDRAAESLLMGAISLVSLIPRRVGMRLGELLGRAIFVLDRRHRRVALRQLAEHLGEGGQVRAVARQVFENLGRLIMEIFYLRRISPAEARRRVTFEGLEHYQRAKAKGRGCLVLTGHFGSFELMAAAFSLAHGQRVNIIVRPLDWRPAYRILVRLRERCGNRSVTKGRTRAMRRLIRLLEEGEMVAVLLDQNAVASEGVFVDFFGRPASTHKGLALLALHTGAPVIPAFIAYEGKGHYRVTAEPEVELVRTGDRDYDVRENTARFTAVIERWVRRYPGQWFWMHRRWKTRPEAEARREEKYAARSAA